MKFSVAIAHAAFQPARRESLKRQLRLLGKECPVFVTVSEAPVTVRHRSEAQWHWSVATDADFCIMMDDDVIPVPDFWTHAREAVSHRPDDIISFYAITKQMGDLSKAGVSWAWSTDAMLGVSWGMPRALLKDFLDWRQEALLPEALDRHPEDAQVCLFALSTGRRIYTVLPSLVEHDHTIGSTWNKDAKPAYAQTSAPFDGPRDWSGPAEFGGFAFVDYHWHILKQLRPDYVSRNRLASLAYRTEREFQEWLRKSIA